MWPAALLAVLIAVCGVWLSQQENPGDALLQLAGGLIPSSTEEVAEVPPLDPLAESGGVGDSTVPEGGEQPVESLPGQVPAATDSGTGGSAEPPVPPDTEPASESPAAATTSGSPSAPESEPASLAPSAPSPASPPPKPKTTASTRPTPTPPKAASRLVEIPLRSDPAGAKVVIDGKAQWSCVTPCTLEIPRGNHKAMASLAGFEPQPNVIQADVGAKGAGIRTSPDHRNTHGEQRSQGADVYVNGKKMADKTNSMLKLPPGYHLVRVEKDGAVAERSIEIGRTIWPAINSCCRTEAFPGFRCGLRARRPAPK